MPKSTLLDIAKRNGSDPAVGLIDETIKPHPELIYVPARTIKGTSYKTLIRTSLPTAGFRKANDGVTASKSTYDNRRIETYILNPRWECDKAVADRKEDGPEIFIFDEATGMLEASLQQVCTNFYYGRDDDYGGDVEGHPGLIDSYDATNMVVDAGGTTGDTGSSVWLIRFGRKHVNWVWGENGSMEVEDPRIETITGENGGSLTGYVQELLAYPGLQVGSLKSVVRIKKLTADSGKGLTDDVIYDALSKFPAGQEPDLILCSKRSLKQLRGSRTATNGTGAPAPIPESIEGTQGPIPIRPSEAILDTEALTL